MVSERETGGRVVVGVDGSDESKEALRWAARQAQLTGMSLLAVISWQYPTYYGGGIPVPAGYDVGGDARKALHDAIGEVLGEPPTVKVETVVLEGPPALQLLDVANAADLLVVGSRGHGAFTGMLLGSVSEHCVAHAKCPVVVVRHHPVSDH